MVCAHVKEDNSRALASGLSPVHIHNNQLKIYWTRMHVYFVRNEIFDVII